jgi:hypothetical protein
MMSNSNDTSASMKRIGEASLSHDMGNEDWPDEPYA